jgi:hypothetical protein
MKKQPKQKPKKDDAAVTLGDMISKDLLNQLKDQQQELKAEEEKRKEAEEQKKREERRLKEKNILTTLSTKSPTEIDGCIVKNYFNEFVYNSEKYNILEPIIKIYNDVEVEDSYIQIKNYYKAKNSLEGSSEKALKNNVKKDTFFCSLDELIERIDIFKKECIYKINDNMNFNNWFKELNVLYEYSQIYGLKESFDRNEIIEAMNKYVDKLEIKDGTLYSIINSFRRYMSVDNNDMKEYEEIFKNKITEKYYIKKYEEVLDDFSNNKYDCEKIEALFSFFSEANILQEVIIGLKEKIKMSKYFIPDLDSSITEEEWSWTHAIWKEMSQRKGTRDNDFEKYLKQKIKKVNVVGKYRIESLNNQYSIQVVD